MFIEHIYCKCILIYIKRHLILLLINTLILVMLALSIPDLDDHITLVGVVEVCNDVIVNRYLL